MDSTPFHSVYRMPVSEFASSFEQLGIRVFCLKIEVSACMRQFLRLVHLNLSGKLSPLAPRHH